MLYSYDPAGLKANITDFLSLCDTHGIGVGLVFFDDCWNGAGANLTAPCVPKKGVHNGCWMQSPQLEARTTVGRFEPYVSDIVKSFGQDDRVLWFEIFNEPRRSDSFSISLRYAAYCWAKEQQPKQPVASCWDDNNATDIVDHHQYSLPWGPNNGVFAAPDKGGFITEAGARWYQKRDDDAGSPLTLVHWLEALRTQRTTAAPKAAHAPDGAAEVAASDAAAASRDAKTLSTCADLRRSGLWSRPNENRERRATVPSGPPTKPSFAAAPLSVAHNTTLANAPPFIPGVMINWEVMTGHSQTRWHWGDPEGLAEPPIPWHSHIFPDGTPVSFTEAAAIRRYSIGRDDFLAVETFLPDGEASTESFLTLEAAESFTLGDAVAVGSAMYEATVWPAAACGTLTFAMGSFEVRLNVSASTLELSAGGSHVATHDIEATGLPEGGIVLASWNMLRVLVTPPTVTADVAQSRIRVWFNPQFSDVTGGSVPAEEKGTLVAMPPRLDAVVAAPVGSGLGGLRIGARDGTFRVDYASILPPTLYGLAAEDEDGGP